MNLEVPQGLTDLLQEFTVSVLRQRPDDIYEFAARYFDEKYEQRKRRGGDLFDESRKEVAFNDVNGSASPPHGADSCESDDDDIIGRWIGVDSLICW